VKPCPRNGRLPKSRRPGERLDPRRGKDTKGIQTARGVDRKKIPTRKSANSKEPMETKQDLCQAKCSLGGEKAIFQKIDASEGPARKYSCPLGKKKRTWGIGSGGGRGSSTKSMEAAWYEKLRNTRKGRLLPAGPGSCTRKKIRGRAK